MWSSGKPKREFLYEEDLADACVYILKNINAETLYDRMGISHINIGCGEDISISDLACIIGDIIDYKGEIRYDTSKPDGTPRKLLDISRLRDLGWESNITLHEGIRRSYNWYVDNEMRIRDKINT